MFYKILSLDRGGFRAFIQTRFLHDIYGYINRNELLKKFGLFSISGGSPVLACCNNIKALKSLNHFRVAIDQSLHILLITGKPKTGSRVGSKNQFYGTRSRTTNDL